jgi:hypothetical protein
LAVFRRSAGTGTNRLRLNDTVGTLEGYVVFRHACKMGLEGDCLEAARIALQIRALAGLVRWLADMIICCIFGAL